MRVVFVSHAKHKRVHAVVSIILRRHAILELGCTLLVAMGVYDSCVVCRTQSADDAAGKPTFNGLPSQLRTILLQFAVQNQFSKLTQLLV